MCSLVLDKTFFEVDLSFFLKVQRSCFRTQWKLPPRKLPLNKLSRKKIATYENCPLWKYPPMKVPPSENRPLENCPQENYPQKIIPRKLPPMKVATIVVRNWKLLPCSPYVVMKNKAWWAVWWSWVSWKCRCPAMLYNNH